MAPISDLMADYLAYGRDIVCVAAVNQLQDVTIPTAPGAARNVITVGGLNAAMQRAWTSQNHGPTRDGRCKPDLLGNAAEDVVAPTVSWRYGFPAATGYGGTSFSAPFVTGAVAEMLDYAKRTGRIHDHRLIKAIVLNSGRTALRADGSPWANSPPTVPLDPEQGTGILDLQRIFQRYAAGRQPTGSAHVPGFDFATLHHSTVPGANPFGSTNGCASYRLGTPATNNADLDVTLVWDRHTFWVDANNNAFLDAADTFATSPTDTQDNLDLLLYKDGALFAASRSTVDTVEHLHLTGLSPAAYELKVERLDVPNSGDSEPYALAWWSSASWTPATPALRITDLRFVTQATIEIAFQLLSGQAGGFRLQSTPGLEPGSTWSEENLAVLTQLNSNTWRFQVDRAGTASCLFRIAALP